MNTLYLHGLYSSPNAEKMAALQQLGHQPIAPHINYAQPGVFAWLYQMAVAQQAQCIIGSSMGGYAGFYLSRLLNVPALLFNPAFVFTSAAPPAVDKTGTHQPLQCFTIGTNDDVVIPSQTFDFLQQTPGNYTLWLAHDMAHQIPLAHFVTFSERFTTLLAKT
jgi:predicted esterase YcpF (UPF0227 family)